jgi:hypothetical protein
VCWPRAKQGRATRPRLGAAGPEEAGDHRGEVCVVEDPAEMSRSDSKENTHPNEAWSETSLETHQKAAPQHQKSREVFC